MTYKLTEERNPKNHLKYLKEFLDDDNMGGVRVALLELLDIGYRGNHAELLDPHKTQIIRMILTYFKREAFYLADALAWQVSELGVAWPEIDTIRNSIQQIKKEQG